MEEEALELDQQQADAVTLLAYYKVGIVTGGPGTGKTRTLQAALPFYRGKSVALCAPTGKAARRIAELTGHPASTVHRCLGLLKNGRKPTYHAGNPLPYDVVIVDEASMLDNERCAMLLAAADPQRTAVFFIGDIDQLPSVGAGQVLEDMLRSQLVPVVRLETVHRAAEGSWVCRMAPRILQGEFDFTEHPDFRFVEANDDLVEQVAEVTAHLVAQHGPEAVQVLVPMNQGDYGTYVLNAVLQERLNPGDSPSYASNVTTGISHRIKVGDKVVATSNDYDRAVFNGELGVVTLVEGRGKESVFIDYGDRDVSYTKTEANEATRLAYALTVHKYQGSEVEWVIVALHEDHSQMLTRRLLYTAVTRAKKGVVIVGQRSAVLRAVSTKDVQYRYTTLSSRIIRTHREQLDAKTA